MDGSTHGHEEGEVQDHPFVMVVNVRRYNNFRFVLEGLKNRVISNGFIFSTTQKSDDMNNDQAVEDERAFST